jgi:hypothetical protein
MSATSLYAALRAGALAFPVLFAAHAAFAQSADAISRSTQPITNSAQPVISLAQNSQSQRPGPMNDALLAKGEASFEGAPSNFHAFASAHAGTDAGVELLTLNFSASTKLTRIESKTEDFVVESGGTCAEGNSYTNGDSCSLLVRFNPQGAGRRLGSITIANTASAEPFALGLGGNGYAPVISFTPAEITTVSGTYPSSVGLLSGAKNLTVDGSDSLYVADTGNNVIRYLDSSGTWKTLASGYTSPVGIAVDTFGEVYFDLPASNSMYEIYDYGPIVAVNGTGTTACPSSTPCTFSTHAITDPGTMSMDPYNHLFFAEETNGVAMSTVQPVPANLVFLYDPFPYQTNPSSPIAVDTSDNIYTLWSTSEDCEIIQQSLYNAEESSVTFNKVAGGRTCGFSGDGGQSGNAEIGATIGQIAFDLAGNLYFSDTANQRVRRIDNSTSQINTIAGNGTAGYAGDNGQSTLAELNAPTGVSVDSQGQVYIISSAATGQVIRKLGPNGFLSFGSVLNGTTSAPQMVTVANTGNDSMMLTSAAITGTNASNFAIDPAVTSCILTPGSYLDSGQSCKVGITFTPSATGTQTASLVFLDNTVTNQNTVQLSGAGTSPAATFVITSPAANTSVTAGTAVTLSVSVTSTTSPAPTGVVAFAVGNTSLGSVTLSSSGVASVTVTETTAGTYSLAAAYHGDSNYPASGPISRSLTVTAATATSCPACIEAHPTGPIRSHFPDRLNLQ